MQARSSSRRAAGTASTTAACIDKTAGAAVGPAAEWLLSVCFCPACADAYQQAGAAPEKLRSAVRAALDEALGWGGGAASRAPADAGELLPPSAADVLLRVRADIDERAARRTIAAVRAAAPGKQALVHAHPDPRAAGSNPGYDPSVLLGPGGADGIVLSCSTRPRPGSSSRARPRPRRRGPGSRRRCRRSAAWAGGRRRSASRPKPFARPVPPSCACTTGAWASASDLAAIRSLFS